MGLAHRFGFISFEFFTLLLAFPLFWLLARLLERRFPPVHDAVAKEKNEGVREHVRARVRRKGVVVLSTMFRRRVVASSTVATRAISTFNFGHPDLSKQFPVSRIADNAAAADAGVKVTSMPNGARIITHNREGPQASIGVYIDAGPKYDPASAPGLSYVMRWALHTSNFDNSLFQIDRAIRAAGASSEHTEVNKRLLGWKLEGRQDKWAKPFENLLSCVSVPRFPEYDIERFRDTMDAIREESRWQTPREYTVDQLETIAFFKEPLGNPRLVPPLANDVCTQEKLVDQWASLCVPSRVIIAASNISHNDVLAAYENAPFPHTANAPHHLRAAPKPAIDQTSEKLQYTPLQEAHEHEHRAKNMGTKPEMDYETIFAVGWRGFGKDVNPQQYAAGLVLQQLIDVAIGDGLRYERGITDTGLRSFYRPFVSTGLVGVTFVGGPKEANKAAISASKLWKELPTDAESVASAVTRATVRFFHNHLEQGRDYIDFLAGSLPVSGGTTPLPAQAVLDAIKSVDAAQIKKAVAHSQEAAPCLYATGDTLGFPSMRQLGF